MEIIVIQTGLTEGELTLEAVSALKEAKSIFLHTEKCGAAQWLKRNGISYTSLDSVYEEAEDFDEHIDMAVEKITSMDADVVHYLVIDLDDETVRALVSSKASVRFIGQKVRNGLTAFAKGAYLTVPAIDIENAFLSSMNDTLITEIDTRQLASDVKLILMDKYPDEAEVYVSSLDRIFTLPLTDLDRLDHYDHTTACFVPAVKELTSLERYDFGHLMMLTKRLRDPICGCPWDREQTHASLKRDCLEEAYELQDAIEKEDDFGIIEELGDVLFACALQIQIGIEHGEFTETDVITGVVQKMISRHTHVFSDDSVSNMDSLLNLWDVNKNKEKGITDNVQEMEAVALALPALLRASKVLKRAAKADKESLPAGESFGATDEKSLGDTLLKLVQWARDMGIDPEKALEDRVNEFIDTFKKTHAV